MGSRSPSCRRRSSAASSAARRRGSSLTLRPSRLASMRGPRSGDADAGEQDRVLDLGAGDHADACVDRRVGADVGVGDPRAGADDRRAADDRPLERRARPRPRPGPRPWSPISSPSMRRSMSSSTSRLASSMSASWPVSFHQPVTVWLSTCLPRVDQVLDRVGDLELAARRGLDRARGVEDRRAEHVDADQRQVGWAGPWASRPAARRARRRARRRRSARGRGPW